MLQRYSVLSFPVHPVLTYPYFHLWLQDPQHLTRGPFVPVFTETTWKLETGPSATLASESVLRASAQYQCSGLVLRANTEGQCSVHFPETSQQLDQSRITASLIRLTFTARHSSISYLFAPSLHKGLQSPVRGSGAHRVLLADSVLGSAGPHQGAPQPQSWDTNTMNSPGSALSLPRSCPLLPCSQTPSRCSPTFSCLVRAEVTGVPQESWAG